MARNPASETAALRGISFSAWWLAAVGVGGLLGSSVGVRYLPAIALRYILALLSAGARMVLA